MTSQRNKATVFLEGHDIKPTTNRILVVKELMASDRPLSLSELERKILTVDKSGIFRTLILFRDHHLVHVIEGGAEGVKYELCHSHDHHQDTDLHPHFFCEECQQTFCLDNLELPEIELPEGYDAHSMNLILKGRCPSCNKK